MSLMRSLTSEIVSSTLRKIPNNASHYRMAISKKRVSKLEERVSNLSNLLDVLARWEARNEQKIDQLRRLIGNEDA